MRSSVSIILVRRILICLLCAGSSALHAQSRTLNQCADEFIQASQKIDRKQATPRIGLFMPNDPYSRLQHEWEECVKGQPIPRLSFTALNGDTFDAASLAGKILVVNFWFMSCAPCRAEIPALNKLVGEYKNQNVLFLGFSTDPADRLTATFVPQDRFDFKIIPDASSIASTFHVRGYPITYVVDGQGIIRDAWLGLGPNKLEPYYRAKAAIDKLLTGAGK